MTSGPEPRQAPTIQARSAGNGSYVEAAPEGWPWQRWAATVLGGAAAWATAIWLSMHLMADMTLHHVALFAHLAALVVGFGGVLSIDFQAAMWLMGRRPLTDVIRFGAASHALIWIGLTGLVVSGVLLNPDFSKPLTRVKMALVLIVLLNGLGALAVQHRLGPATRRLSRRLLAGAGALAMISQLAWWGAIFIGFMNSNDRLQTSQDRPVSVQQSTASPSPAPSSSPSRSPSRTGASPGARKSASAKRHMRGGETRSGRKPSTTPEPMGN